MFYEYLDKLREHPNWEEYILEKSKKEGVKNLEEFWK